MRTLNWKHPGWPVTTTVTAPCHCPEVILHILRMAACIRNPTVCPRKGRLGGSSKRPVVTADRPICPSHGAGRRFTGNRTKPGRGTSRQALVSQTRQLPAWRHWKQLRPHLYFKHKSFPKSRKFKYRQNETCFSGNRCLA